jgi:hypothetical protein
MQDMFDYFGGYVLSGILTIAVFIISRFALGYGLVRMLMKIMTLGIVLFYSDKLMNVFEVGIRNIIPADNNFSAFLCQFGFLEGLNIYLTLLMTIYTYKLTIKVLIQS